MNRAISLIFAFFGVLVFGAGGAPLRCPDVADDPARLLHIDFDALRETYLGKYFLYELNKPEMHSNMVAFQSIFGIDLRTQLHGVTIYTANSTPNDNVVITYADFDPGHIVKLITGGDGDFTMTNNGRVIYSWIDPHDKPGVRKYGAVLDGRMIAGNTRRSVLDALAVADGSAPSFSPRKAAHEFHIPGATNFVVACARNLEFLGSNPNLALLKLSKSLKFQAGESDEVMKANVTVDAADAQTARQMSVAVEALIEALAAQTENPRAAKLASGMAVQLDGSILRVGLSVSSHDALAALKAYNQKTSN